MKNKNCIIFLIVLLSILSICLIGFMIIMMNVNMPFSKFMVHHHISNNLIIDEIYNDSFQNIFIESNASDIYIKHSDNNEVKVLVYGDKDKVKVKNINNILSINTNIKKCVGLCFNQKLAKVEVYIPKNYKNDINIINKYGDVFIDEFNSANMNIKNNCGDIEVLGANIAEIKDDFGDISLVKSNKADIFASCGDIDIGQVTDLKAINKYGNIKIDKVNNFLDLVNNCGDIEAKYINLNKNSKIKSSLGDIEIGLTNEIYIDAKTSLGDVDVNNNYKKSNITLKIDNSCGDIEVDN